MFEKINEKYIRWIIRIIIFIGLYLIFKIWLLGLAVYFPGGTLFNINGDPHIHYFFTIGGILAIIFFIISYYLIIRIKKSTNIIKNIKYAFIILILGVILKPIFFILSPDFKFYLTPVEKQYLTQDRKMKDIDLYLESIKKYCDDSKEYLFTYKYSRSRFCGLEGKYISDYDTVDEYIKVLEFAKNNDMRYLYSITFGGAKKFGLKKVIEKYHDKTFQAYTINNISDSKVFKLIKLYLYDNDILLLSEFKNKKLIEFKNKKVLDNYGYWENVKLEFIKKLKGMGINYKLF